LSEETFANALENRILLFDGAMGTEIQRYDPKSEISQMAKMDLTMDCL